MEIATVILLVILIGIIAFMLVRQKESINPNDQSAVLIQQQITSLRSEVTESLKSTTESVSRNLKDTSDSLFQNLKSTTDSVNQQLTIVRDSLKQTTEQFNQQLSSQTNTIGTRLDNAAKVMQDLQKSQSQLMQAGVEIKELGQSMTKLEELLKAPKLRGGLGELLLEDILKQVLPISSYETQYRFRNGNTVDAIIRTANGIISIDSKFPLENFRKTIDAQSDQEKKTAYKQFINDVKKHIDAISQKYILPDEGTFDFALMYIPAENIYYETIIKNEVFGDSNDLYAYASARRVFSVSPNTFYAQLQVIALGFKGMEVEKSAKEIIQNLARLQGDLTKFNDDFETVGKHITNAKNKYDDAARKLDTFEAKLQQVSGTVLVNGNSSEQRLTE
ncbi:MAG: DNA recombination protein RmuC [Bacteroidota bacterium]|nr:DNA recombination protein RmuC [Bacteroidota bacterium]